MTKLQEGLADLVGGFLLARKTFNYCRAEEKGIEVQYRGKSYRLEAPGTSRMGYVLGVLTRPFRLVNFLLDVPQEFFENSGKS